MSWGIRQAANIIHHCVALVPEESDQVLEKLRAFDERTRRQSTETSEL